MAWLAVRAAMDTAIASYERLATGLAGHAQRVDVAQARAVGTLTGSSSPHVANGLTLIGAARSELAHGMGLAKTAATRCREYLAAVDPDGAAGSVTGLPEPQGLGDVRGGHTDGHGVAPLGRRPISDVSRGRTHVFSEFGPEGFKDLLDRDDGMVALRSRWLDAGGHARLRHGGTVTDDRLKERVLRGRDPVNAAPTDWELGRNHPTPRHATAFTSDTAAVYAEMTAWDHPASRQARADAEASGQIKFAVAVPTKDAFGQNYSEHMRGWTRVGSVGNPQGVVATSFGDSAEIFAIYQRESPNDEWRATTCYPRPGA